MTSDERPYMYVEDGTLWVRPMPDESAADFIKRAVRARGPLTDSEKVQLRDIFAPTLDQPAADDAA
ncbi:hypothetical protein [Streptomyces incanus]|uniref:DUF397 domain-containing protein n=1 Tax=Streptomyces incanus TaxID=887453 RepID=A0ABW0XLU9_9ACTN